MVSSISGLPVYTAEQLDCDPAVTVCFTGHRPEKIVPFRDRPAFSALTNSVVEMLLYRYVELAEENGYVNFISGLAKGADLWAAKSVIRRKQAGSSIRLIGAMPFIRHAESLYGKNKAELAEVEINSDILITVNPDPGITFGRKASPGYSPHLYSDRNRFMVDHSSAVIAFYDDGGHSWSGTGQTVRYAETSGKKVYRFGTSEVYDIIRDSGGSMENAKEIISRISTLFY